MPEDTRILPLADVTPAWEREDGMYPDTVRVAMADGQVVTYRRDDREPHPCLVSALEILSRMPVYKPRPQESREYRAKHAAEKKDRWQRFLDARSKE